jgi:hypothetical protein
MTQHKAEDHHPQLVEKMLHAGGFSHLRARKYGNAVIVESGPQSDPMKHMRLRRDTVHLWRLEFADHRDRWEQTPYREQIEDLVQLVIDDFPWTLAGVF